MMLFCKIYIYIFNFIIIVKFAGFVKKNVFELYLIKYIKYRDQIQIPAFKKNKIQIQIRKIKIQIRKNYTNTYLTPSLPRAVHL